MNAVIKVKGLKKDFQVKKRSEGLVGALGSFISPKYNFVNAVNDVNFTIEKGERIAFIGPNGAGKSTTIKMMCGILHPSEGDISVLGLTPWKDRKELGHRIGAVFGQKSQLWYHLPAKDTFDLLASIYELDNKTYRHRLKDLIELFQIGDILKQTVRKLSLGQRMRCEIVASLLHRPDILFLDEPTIGLDVTAKAVIRDLIKERSAIDGTTIFLTSHDTGDMERVCDRVMVINHGELLIDSELSLLRKKYIQKKCITFLTSDENLEIEIGGLEKVHASPFKSQFEVDVNKVSIDHVISEALRKTKLRDITVEDPPMDEIVQDIYQNVARKKKD